jgi:hypothetical protein
VRLNESLCDLLTGRLALACANLVAALFFLGAMLLYHAPPALGVLALAGERGDTGRIERRTVRTVPQVIP